MADRQKKGGLERKAPLRSGSSLTRKTALQQGGKGLKRGTKGLKRTEFKRTASAPKAEPTTRPDRKSLQKQSPSLSKGGALRRTQFKGARQPKPLPRSAMKSNPHVASPEETAARALVAERSGGFCEKCGNPGGLEKAHRIARSQGGKWAASNLLDLCRTCHADNHARPQNAYDGGWHLRSLSDTLSERVLLWKSGRYDWALLDDEGGWSWEDAA